VRSTNSALISRACTWPSPQFDNCSATAHRDGQLTIIRWPNADTLGAHAGEHILGEAHPHRQGNTLIEFQREDAILARLLGSFLEIFVDGHGSPPVATVP